MPTLSPVRVTGDPDNRVNIIFAGDGYRATEIETVYKTHVDNAINYFFDNVLAEPFGRYDGFFNVYRANVVSTQSGADIPPENIFRNTALDASYYWDGVTERLLYVDDAKTDSAVAGALAGTSITPDMVFVSVNATKYGGGGGTYAVFAGGNSDAREIALHEVGHSFAGLADEYFDPGTFYSGPELPQPNVTIDPTGAKWAQWIGYNQPGIGEIGAYEGGYYHEFGVYRPSLNSKMQMLGNLFDAVGREQFILDFYGKVDPIDAHTPNSGPVTGTDSVFVDLVDADVTNIRWSVDGKVVADGTASSFDLSDNGFGLGTFAVTAFAYDETGWLRVEEALGQQAVDWAVQIPTGATGGNNTLTGTARIDKIFALGGADVVSGLAADDVLDGGSGNDVLRGGDGSDHLTGGLGTDYLYGNAGNDLVYGNGGNDYLYGNEGSDTLHGVDGADKLDGGPGVDWLYGDGGNDTIYFGSYADHYDGGLGFDTLSFAKKTAGWTLSEITSPDTHDVTDAGGSLANFEKVIGSPYADTIQMDGGVIDGGGGNDHLALSGWNTGAGLKEYGGSGNDSLAFVGQEGAGDIVGYGGSGNDTLFVHDMTGGSGNDTFFLDYSFHDVVPSNNGGAIVRDFTHGYDHINFEGENPGTLTHSGDIWTVNSMDDSGNPYNTRFEIAGITSLSSSEYDFHLG